MGLSVHVRYEIEEVASTAGLRWLVWRSVDGGAPQRCGAGRGLHISRRDAADTVEGQRRADRAAGTRLGVTIVEVG